MAVFRDRLFLAHATNPKNGNIFIASSANGNFQGATKISNWVGGNLCMAAFYDHLFLVHANPNNGRIFISSSAAPTWRASFLSTNRLGYTYYWEITDLGHTVERHVGLSPEDCERRAQNNHELRCATSWRDKNEAFAAMQQAWESVCAGWREAPSQGPNSDAFTGINTPVPANWGKCIITPEGLTNVLRSNGVINSSESKLVIKYTGSERGWNSYTRYYTLTMAFPLVPGLSNYIDDNENILPCLMQIYNNDDCCIS